MEHEIKNPVVRFVVYGHVFLALGAAAQVWWASDFVRWVPDVRLCAFVFLLSFAAYGSMRLLRMNATGLEGSAMMQWYRSHHRLMLLLVFLSVVAAAAIGWPLWQPIAHALWLPGLIAAFYTLPLALTGGRPIGLRRIPFVKAFIIACVWASVAVLLPGTQEFEGRQHVSSDDRWFAAIWAGFFFALAVAFDVRDLPHDRPGLRTIPQVFGQSWAKAIAMIALIPMLLMLLTMVAMSYYPIEQGWREPGIDWSLLLPAMGVALTGALIAKADPAKPWWYWSLLLDGSMILLPLLSWVGGLV
jgi:hypothetical protein